MLYHLCKRPFHNHCFELLPKEVEQKIIAVDHASATDILRNRLVCSSWNTMIEHTFKTLQSVLSLFPQFKLVEVNSGGFGTVQNVLQRGFELAYTTFHLANVMVGFLPFNAICESFCIGTELTTRICSCLSQKTNNRNLLEFLSNPPVNENSSGWIVIRSTETRMYCQQNLLFATAIIDVEYDLKKNANGKYILDPHMLAPSQDPTDLFEKSCMKEMLTLRKMSTKPWLSTRKKILLNSLAILMNAGTLHKYVSTYHIKNIPMERVTVMNLTLEVLVLKMVLVRDE